MSEQTVNNLYIITDKTKRLKAEAAEITTLIDSLKDNKSIPPALRAKLDTQLYILRLLQNWVC